jgi:hypothetical protein
MVVLGLGFELAGPAISDSRNVPSLSAVWQLEWLSLSQPALRHIHMEVVKADIPCSLGGGRRGFDPSQLRRTKRAFFPPWAIWNEA